MLQSIHRVYSTSHQDLRQLILFRPLNFLSVNGVIRYSRESLSPVFLFLTKKRPVLTGPVRCGFLNQTGTGGTSAFQNSAGKLNYFLRYQKHVIFSLFILDLLFITLFEVKAIQLADLNVLVFKNLN